MKGPVSSCEPGWGMSTAQVSLFVWRDSTMTLALSRLTIWLRGMGEGEEKASWRLSDVRADCVGCMV